MAASSRSEQDAEDLHPELQAEIRESKLGMSGALKPESPSQKLFFYQDHRSKGSYSSTTSCGSNIQTPELMGDILIEATT